MNKFIDIVKGALIGLANIVAGLSGATIAVLVNCYDKLIDFCSNPLKNFKKGLFLLIGIIIGILGGTLILSVVYKKYTLEVSFLFCGLIISGIPALFKKVKGIKLNSACYVAFILSLLVMIGLPLLTASPNREISFNLGDCIIIVLLGFIAAGSMIVPGISGSMVLASFGFYSPILDLVKNTLSLLVKFNFSSELLFDIILLLLFLIGCVIGFILVSKVIRICFKRYYLVTYSSILGLVIGSIFAILIVALKNRNYFNELNDIFSWGIGVLLLVVTSYIGIYLYLKEQKKSMQVNYLKEAEKYRNDGIELIKELVSYKSVLDNYDANSTTPFGIENKRVLNFLLNKAKEDGFVVKNVDNYAGHIEYGPENGDIIGVLGHLDVVPVSTEEWNSDPFTALVEDGRVYGRGTMDDKGPVAAAYYAIKLIKDLNLPVSKKVRLIVGCDEESGSRCLEHYFKVEAMPNIGFSPDAEFPAIYGEKARLTFDITGRTESDVLKNFTCGVRYNVVPSMAIMELNIDLKDKYIKFIKERGYNGKVDGDKYIAYGKSAHAMCPQNGVNAAFVLVEFLEEYASCDFSKYINKYLSNDPFGYKLGIDIDSKDMGKLTMNIGIVNVSNGEFRIGINCRIPLNDHRKIVEEKLNQSFEDFKEIEFNIISDEKRHYVDPDSELVNILLNSYRVISKDYDSQPFTIGGGTYASFIDNAVAFGPLFPGREDVCHISNEYIIIDDFVKSIAIYAMAIYELIK